MKHSRHLLLFILLLAEVAASAQTVNDNQFAAEYQYILPFRNVYFFDTEVGYQTLISDQDKWRSYHITPNLDKNIARKLDLSLQLPLYYTIQTSNYNTFESRISPAVRYIISTGKRIESRFVVRYDWRFVKAEDLEWQTSNRIRFQIDFTIPLNRKTVFEDKMLYAISNLEYFMVIDHNIHERFANLIISKLGLGYRLNYKNRFELVYQYQKSRQTVASDFDTQDNVFKIRYVMFFSPSKPVQTSN